MREVLRLEKINKSFPGVKALTDVDLEIHEGEVLGLIGENGAGKSTLMKIISGAYTKDSGEIYINGQKVEIKSPLHAETLGVSIIYQELNLIDRMTVAENVFMGRWPLKKTNTIDWRELNTAAQKYFDELGLNIKATDHVRTLSVAQKQMVEIVRAVSFDSKLIIMDEPTSSLSGTETETLFQIVNKLKREGMAIIFITHRMDEIFAICDKTTVLRDGCYVGTKKTSDLTKSEMISMMIGRELTQQFPDRNHNIKEKIFEVKNLEDFKNRVKNVSFSVKSGEVLGFYGLVGAGRTETMRVIFGVDEMKAGEVFIHNEKVDIKHPRDAISHGVGFLTENRRDEGLLLESSVRDNTVIVALKKVLTKGLIDYKKEAKIAQNYVDMLSTRTPSINQRVMFLSGGNQQKVVLAKWLFADSEIIIFDEPTRGIDVGARREIYQIINELSEAGKAVIAVSSDIEEVMGISDRIIVMHEGRITGKVDKKDFSQNVLAEYAVGERTNV